MAIISSHVLDSVNGISASGIRVELFQLSGDMLRTRLFETETDGEGRISETIDVSAGSIGAICELVFHTEGYFTGAGLPEDPGQIMDSVVVRISLPDPDARYHIPVVLSPHSYTVWWSG